MEALSLISFESRIINKSVDDYTYVVVYRWYASLSIEFNVKYHRNNFKSSCALNVSGAEN